VEVAGEQLDHPGQLGQAEDAVAGQVADVGHAGERQQVVAAPGGEGMERATTPATPADPGAGW